MPPRVAATTSVAALVAGLVACAPATHDDRPTVVVSFYPLQYVVEQIAGERVLVDTLTPPGADPHSLELSPARVADLAEADLVVYLSGFQAATDQAVASAQPDHVVDAAAVLPAAAHGEASAADPHLWLDPTLLAAVGQQVAAALATVDPEHAAEHAQGERALTAQLDALDADYRSGLATCAGATLVTAHEAFGHLARRYGLVQVGLAGVDPEVEPSPARLRQVAEVVREHGVRTLYFETTAAPGVTRTLAEDLGVEAAVLDPLETRPALAAAAEDYEEVMRGNLEALRAGLRCG
ncbi:metal ABC transporter substrate-binding protein [Cellulomonas soli]|uniref:metal ABC transporter substrate-binding protein n=1 Tax=Cellulomonas soli TaxID=931535 RepID=UPI003F84DFC3